MPAPVQAIIDILEELFPLYLAAKWDNPGLQVGSSTQSVANALVVLDVDEGVVDYAAQNGFELVITHHPIFFAPLKSIDYDASQGRLVKRIIEAGLTVYSAHTNLDAGARGLNQVLAERLGLQDISPLDRYYQDKLIKLVVYVPASHIEAVRAAVLSAGAGHIGRYQDCCFMSKGTGSFRPLAGSRPFIGQVGDLEEVEEYRLETVVPQPRLAAVLNKMSEVHPYEEIAYDLYPLEREGPTYSMGRTGYLAEPATLEQVCIQVKQALGLSHVVVAGDLQKAISKVGVVSGAGADFALQARMQGCELLVTGDLKYHQAKDALDMGLAVIDAGHEGTEGLMSAFLSRLLSEEVERRGLCVKIFSRDSRKVLNIC